MQAIIQPSVLNGTVRAPASKSCMQRACAAALLSGKKWIIRNPGTSNDDKSAVDIIQKLGATVFWNKDEWIIDSTNLKTSADIIDCGESGLGIRMFTPIAALQAKEITLTGSGSLQNRPMDFFDEILPQLKVSVKSNNGKLPIQTKGPLFPKNIEIDGALSSQFLTGLLMAYAASPDCRATIKVNNLKSKPYIDLTLAIMNDFGLQLPENHNYEEFIFHNQLIAKVSSLGGDLEKALERAFTIESDWSSGAFILVAGAIAGNITVTGLDMMSTQADKKITEVLMACNAAIAFEAKGIKVHAAALTAFEFDATDCPDLFPPLVALAAYCKGISKIKGISRLAHKESNRGITLQKEFGKMGVPVELNDDEMLIHGGKGVKGAVIHSHHDHRIAMACAVAALGATGKTIIEEAEAINKSYPDFYNDLKKLKAGVSLVN